MAGGSGGCGCGTRQGVVGQEGSVDHGAVVQWWSWGGARGGGSWSGGDGRRRRAVASGGVARDTVCVVVATDSKVDTDGNSGNDDEGDDADEDLVLGLHSLLLFERHGCYDVTNGDG